MRIAAIEPLGQLANGPRLVAGQLEVGDEAEAVVHGRHVNPSIVPREPRQLGRSV